ncbi:polymorphic toxin type 15 domain-containing protein [Xenorhabdus miraniensis]|uniref:Novel toxin 15 domain-containing protein n=1 Tax=Xenorhabdus miraniensis TaxID=351674 RepID=A0A2D0JMS2_9GAMM|nr:polymorphic toxin type 15 domain-containing protein [Xenorhabdus miraniensis]PHM47627.1 hypothetical protein Xmir_02954 [Xenorhabdus miraniensis]
MAKIKKTPPKPASDEPLWKKRVHDDAPTGEGNTLGEITGQPPKSTEVPKEANPVIKPTTQDEGGFLNGLAKVGNAVVDAGKAVGNAAVGVATGVGKNLANTAIDVGELAWKGIQYAAASEMEHSAMMQGAWGNEADSKQLLDAANAVRENASNTNWERYTMEGSAEEFGDFIADFNPKGAIKGGIKAIAKGGSKVMSMIADKEKKGIARSNSRAKRRETRAAERDKKTPPKDPEELKKELKEKKGGKVKGVKRTEVPCFDPHDNDTYKSLKTDKERKAFLKEYADQLRRQKDGINNMSADEFKIARDAYNNQAAKNKAANKKGGGRHNKAASAQRKFNRNMKEDIKGKIYQSLRKRGKSAAEAKKESKKRADEVMRGLAALHEPDMSAGSYFDFDPKRAGNRNINGAIGGSWPSRLKTLDDAAQHAINSGLGDAKMNVQLELCRGKKK